MTKKTITNPDGTTRTEVHEQIDDRGAPPKITSYVEEGRSGGKYSFWISTQNDFMNR